MARKSEKPAADVKTEVAKIETSVSSAVEALQAVGLDETKAEEVAKVLGAETAEDLALFDHSADLTAAGMNPVQAKRLLAQKKTAAVEAASSMQQGPLSFDGILPTVPTDESWLTALKLGGVLKVEESTVISAIKVALAHKVDLFGVPKKLVALMEDFAEENDEQVDPSYFNMRDELTRREYASVFEAIPGLTGAYVTEGRKKKLLERIDTYLWPAIFSYYQSQKNWQEQYMQNAANPMAMMNLMATATGGAPMAPGMMQQAPDTGGLRDAADAVADAVNKVFAGTGVQITAALAYEANKVKETLLKPGLPALLGVANREQMLKKLDVAVSATYPRLEANLTRFVMSVMQASDQPSGSEELQYFSSLSVLGSQISWDQLGVSSSTGPSRLGKDSFPG